MKKYLYAIVTSLLFVSGVYAACEEITLPKVYNSCRSGYYKSGSDCVACPSITNTKGTSVKGTSANKNTTGNTGCFMKKCTSFSSSSSSSGLELNPGLGGTLVIECDYFSDASGVYAFTEDCYYSN